ncbi:MAG: sulfide/dihydroorotate dehydrogenase-like FAD/NAD-binding protein [Candidatus Omnitrophota bacterium]
MHSVIEKTVLAGSITMLKVEAPMVVREAKPGQFVVVRLDEFSERIPLTICDMDKDKGTITMIIQEAGRSTKDLCSLNPGDSIMDVLGPLGNPSQIKKFGTVVMIGGGVGSAELLTVVRALKEAGNRVITILGARNRDLIILEETFRGLADEVIVTTDDGSYGDKGLVTDALANLFKRGEKIDRIICCGPLPMMRAVTETSRPKAIPITVSLNAILLDATGMCGSCRCTVAGKTRFSCVDGPEFDGYQVDFDELLLRNKRFLGEEKKAMDV